MKKILLAGVIGTFFAGMAQAQTAAAPQEESSMRLGDVLGILVGAYQGAADAAEKSGHTLFAEELDADDVAYLQRTLNHLQGELQSLVDKDGNVDTARAAEFLNALQQLQGETRFDFVRAEQALQRIEPRDITLQAVLDALANPGSASLSAEVAQLKQLAGEQIGSLHGEEALIDLLKIVYADRKLGSVDAEREARAHALVADILQQGSISEAHYMEIRKLLDAIGSAFKPDYKAWNKARDSVVRRELKREEMDSVLSVLHSKNLTPEQREQILRALQR